MPVICTVIGEGGSGGALAIGVGDRVNMLQYSTFSVISPEGCASILWKTVEKAPEAAMALGITANRLYDLGLIDEVIVEPLGGAHRDFSLTFRNVSDTLEKELNILKELGRDTLLNKRMARIMSHGFFSEK